MSIRNWVWVRRLRRRWAAGASRLFFACVVLMAIAALLVLPFPHPFDGRLIKAMETAAHFPLFAAGFFAWSLLVQPRRNWPALRLLLVGVALVAIAFELLQALTGRDPDALDALFSSLGGWAAVLWWYSTHTYHRLLALGARAMALLMGLAVGVPSSLIVADRIYARASFPLLASFEGRSEVGRWWEDECDISRVEQQATHGRYALRVALAKSPRSYPGLFMSDLPRDWTGYRQLCFDLYLTGGSERALWIRADDQPGYPPYGDRAQTLISLSPGPNSICLDLASFLATPSGRPLDRAQIMRWGMFFEAPLGGESFFLDHVRLVR